MQHGRYFVHEHPIHNLELGNARNHGSMLEACVHSVEIDQCETGTVPPSQGDDGKEELIRSHSGFLTKSEEIARNLHTLRFQIRDKDDPKLVTSILEGLIEQMETDAKRGEEEWNLYAMEIGVHVDEDAVDFDNHGCHCP